MGRNIHGRAADQRPEQASDAPEQANAGIGGDQVLALELLADQHQRQGIDPARHRTEQHQCWP
ncbi:hypothetical protein D3C75_1067250 [compost metagenome]